MNPTKKFREFFAGLSDLVRSRDPIIETMHVSAALRDADWARVSAMAGLTPDGSIAPPPPSTTISHEPVQWRTRYPKIRAGYDHGGKDSSATALFIGKELKGIWYDEEADFPDCIIDEVARRHVEGHRDDWFTFTH